MVSIKRFKFDAFQYSSTAAVVTSNETLNCIVVFDIWVSEFERSSPYDY